MSSSNVWCLMEIRHQNKSINRYIRLIDLTAFYAELCAFLKFNETNVIFLTAML